MRIGILGGLGNIAEVVSGVAAARGHQVYVHRFHRQIGVPGVPRRSPRSRARLGRSSIVGGASAEVVSSTPTRWLDNETARGVDAFLVAYPSYLMRQLASETGHWLAGKPIINLSDRFLGTYELLVESAARHGVLPSLALAFNGVPTIAVKPHPEGAVHLAHVKPALAGACWPPASFGEGLELAESVLGSALGAVHREATLLQLAFENIHCLEHALIDLQNLKSRRMIGGAAMFGVLTYTPEMLVSLALLASERDQLARKVVGRGFMSISDYDRTVYGGDPLVVGIEGTADYRRLHKNLASVVLPERRRAFGYEDVGWSLVPMESLAAAAGVPMPRVSALIDEWCAFTRCDYRSVGRTLSRIDAPTELAAESAYGIHWLPGILDGRLGQDASD